MDIEAEVVEEHDRWKEQKHKHKHHHHYYSREGGKGAEHMDGVYNHPNILGGGYAGGCGGGCNGNNWSNGIAPVGMFGVFGGFGNGLGRDGHHGGGNDAHLQILQALGDIKGEVPLAVATASYNVINEVHDSENAIQGSITAAKDSLGNQVNQLTIAGMQQTFGIQQALCAGFSNLKDVTVGEAEKTRFLFIEEGRERDRQRIIALEADVRQGNITINNTNQQWQSQLQFQDINNKLGHLFNTFQRAQADNQNVIVGNAGATTTGAQTNTPTNVNTR